MDKTVGWHGHEFEQTLGDGEGQRSLAFCSPWGHKAWDTTEQLNNKNYSETSLDDLCVSINMCFSYLP